MKQLRCDECGRFIPLADFEAGKAVRRLIFPDTPFTSETYETLCKDHHYPTLPNRRRGGYDD